MFISPHDPLNPLPMFLVQIIIVLVVTHLTGRLLRLLHQPMVVGQIIGGFLLGPSVLGHAPGWSPAIFPRDTLPQFGLVASLGMVFFMFMLGLEVDVSLMLAQGRAAAPIALAAIVTPFFLGSLLSLWVYHEYATPDVSRVSFILFFGTALSFSAFPVLASILKANELLADPMGILAFSCAAIDDVSLLPLPYAVCA